MSNRVDVIEGATERRSATAHPVSDNFARWLQAIFWSAAVLLGLLQSWVHRHAMQSDGISYLDMGDAYLRSDWQMAINSYWSPLYSWLLGVALRVIKPSPYWEFPVAHLVNFFVYVGALFCFAFFLNEVIRHQRGEAEKVGGGEWVGLPEWAWVVAGYTLFTWSSLELITLRYVTPDLCVAAFVYLAAGLIVRIRRGVSGRLTFVVLGGVLGFGYLAKAAMLPLAFVFVGVSWWAALGGRRGAERALVAGVVFLLVSSPFLIALSWAKGRVTFGDSGRLNYAWYVNGVGYRHWQGEPAGSGTPRHPTRKVMVEPEVYEFGSPVGGTYPHWYDPSYWYDGIAPRFNLIRHIKNMLWRPDLYSFFFFALYGSLVIGLFTLFYMSGRGRLVIRDVAASWFLLVPALAGFAMYMQVYVETRFVGSFFTLMVIGLFASVRLPDSPESRRLVACVLIIIVAMFGLAVGPSNARAAYTSVGEISRGRDAAPNVYWEVAEELKRMGLQPGDKVASLSYSNNDNVYWSRLAKVQIVAEMFSGAYRKDEDDFWTADEVVRARIIETLAKAGANGIVANSAPSWAAAEGWRRIGSTDHYVYFLPR
ncbi:MAG: hypothetical protein H0U18_05530 [Pyrinomonadaceae bacterium]|nr:hypothetical protein [Pyrinomonadaceae bacterium]